MLELLERQTKLTANQWKIISAAILGDMLDFFDFFLIGFVLAFIVGKWHLTYGQSAWILLSAGIGAIPGAFFWGWMADAIGRRWSGILACLGAAVTLVVAGYCANAFIGAVSVFWLMLMVHSFFGGGSYAIIAPYMAEVWPAGLRASGLGFGYGVGNLGKIISPLGLAVIVGTSNFVKPAATLAGILPAMIFLAFWAVLAALAFLLVGIETKGRSIEQIDRALIKPSPAWIPAP